VQQRSDNVLAEDRRLLAELFALATSAASARELRTYGVASELARRHSELGEQVRRRAVRAAMISAAWEALGWTVFTAGLVSAIVVLVLRAAHGHVSPGQVVMAVSLLRRAQTQISNSTDTAGSFNTSLTTARKLLWLETHAHERSAPAARRVLVPAHLQRGIAFKGVEVSYGAGERVLGPIELQLARCTGRPVDAS
jgi:ATP-binding cassette subfamily B protein